MSPVAVATEHQPQPNVVTDRFVANEDPLGLLAVGGAVPEAAISADAVRTSVAQ